MASPFTVFRKHQKTLIATLGILTILAFVLIPPFMQYLGARVTQDPVVVKTTKYGDLHERELGYRLAYRGRLLGALADARAEIGENPAQARQMVERVFGPNSEESVVVTWLLAQRAQELGLVVDNDAIMTFLRDFTQNRLKTERMQANLGRHGFTELSFFQALRDELLAMQVRRMFSMSTAATTPAQRWDYYARLNRKATIEGIALPVDQYADEVPDPDQAALRKFFEQHKDDYSLPDSPVPGFREPQKVNVEYFKVNLDQFEESAVGDEEIKQEYEKNQEKWDRLEKQSREKSSAEKPDADKPGAEKPATEKPDAEKPDSEKPAAEKPATEMPVAEEPTIEKPAKEEPGTEKPATEKPATEEPPKEEPAKERPAEEKPVKEEPAKAPATNEGSSAVAASPLKFTAFLQEEKKEQQPDDAKPSTPETKAPAAEEKPADEPAEKPEPAAPQSPAGEPKAKEKPADTAESPVAKTPAGETVKGPEKPSVAEPPSKTDKTGLPASLSLRIRRDLTARKLTSVFGELQVDMKKYFDAWSLRDPKKEPPARPDFAALASRYRKHGLTTAETGLVSQYVVTKFDIARSYVDANATFVGAAYGRNTPLFKSMRSVDLSGNQYLFWKVADEKERIAKFDDEGVEPKVLRAWKMVEARSLAEQAAERLAAEARGVRKPLKDVFLGRSDVGVFEAEDFSWMTQGSLGLLSQTLEVSTVPGVDVPGSEFMRAVFDLSPGEIAVAMNQPKTVAYVVRMVSVSPSDKALWDLFETDVQSGLYRQHYEAIAYRDRLEMGRAWMEEIKSSAGLEWKRPSEQRGSEQPFEE